MNIITPNYKWNGSLTYGNKPDMIVLHHAAASSCTAADIHRWHVGNGWVGIGYHYFVRKDGSIYKGRPDNAWGAHCPGVNNHSIGICAEGNFEEETMSDVQKNSIIELCRSLELKVIKGHKEVPYSTSCPGKNYPLNEIRDKALKPVVPPAPEVPKKGTVTASVLNVRDGAGTSYRILGTLKRGTVVRIDKKVGDWYSIFYGDHGGYVSANYIK